MRALHTTPVKACRPSGRLLQAAASSSPPQLDKPADTTRAGQSKAKVNAERVRLKQAGLKYSVLICSLTGAAAVALHPDMLPSPQTLSLAAAGTALAASGAIACLFIAKQGKVHAEWHDGKLWVESGVPPAWAQGQVAAEGSVEV